jgi:hypothetical protein
MDLSVMTATGKERRGCGRSFCKPMKSIAVAAFDIHLSEGEVVDWFNVWTTRDGEAGTVGVARGSELSERRLTVFHTFCTFPGPASSLTVRENAVVDRGNSTGRVFPLLSKPLSKHGAGDRLTGRRTCDRAREWQASVLHTVMLVIADDRPSG